MVVSILLYNIIYYILVANSQNSILYLVFCSDNLVEVEKSLEPLLPLDSPSSKHTFSVGLTNPSCDTTQFFYYFKHINFDYIRSYTNSFDWHSTLLFSTILNQL